MDFDCPSAFPLEDVSYGQNVVPYFDLGAQGSSFGQNPYDFPLPQHQSYAPNAFAQPPHLPPQFDIDLSPFVSPNDYTPSFPYYPSPEHLSGELSPTHLPFEIPFPELPIEGPSTAQPTAPSVPLLPFLYTPPTPEEIENFHFCPFTENGQICGHVYWGNGSQKAIHRHLKKHMVLGVNAKCWACPNLRCMTNPMKLYKRGEQLKVHRKSCDAKSLNPHYVLLPDIILGNDREATSWIEAGKPLRESIKRKLRSGVPWSPALLGPVTRLS
ncbi:hypothetical protein BJ322DRAFT_1020031 [Thelephora terrestris]|uniref:Uncharacterized protein n=1 Tax=Thelephora terrestris TaxID=56493 RepID=A0A9P6HFB9_9AGAM|nr:hypothetical protein BJ322DRAFT_1020031 [Thelephora terrestris]